MLAVCDRFKVDPDRAAGLDASVIGLLQADTELKAAARG